MVFQSVLANTVTQPLASRTSKNLTGFVAVQENNLFHLPLSHATYLSDKNGLSDHQEVHNDRRHAILQY
jgi:hypothetical protein